MRSKIAVPKIKKISETRLDDGNTCSERVAKVAVGYVTQVICIANIKLPIPKILLRNI